MTRAEFIVNDAEVRAFLSDLTKRTDQIRERDKAVVGILSQIVFRDIMQHFDQEQGSEAPWPQWSASYTKHMERIRRGDNKKLQFDGKLRQAFQPTNVRTSIDGILWFNPAKTASGFPYAAAHDEGGGRLPQRQFMWLSGEAMESIESAMLKFLETGQ